MLRAQHPAREGRFLEAILKAERDVASTAASNRGHEKPGTAASPERLVAWSLRAGPGNGDGGGTWADNATAERREAGLLVAREVLLPRKRGVARYCATRTRLDVSGRSANSPRSGVGSDEGEKRKEKNPDVKRAGNEETALFDIVTRNDAGGASVARSNTIASTTTRSCPGRARASARLFARGASSRARAGTQGPHDVPSPRWVHASQVYPTCARLSADLGQARDRCLAEFTLGPREARTRGLARDTRAERGRGRASTPLDVRHVPYPSGTSACGGASGR